MDDEKYEAECLELYRNKRKEVAIRMKSHRELWPVAVGKVVGPGNVKKYRHGQDLYKLAKPAQQTPVAPVVIKEDPQLRLF